ncbi:MAG: hypothetical protein WDW38_003819 [Sanguina aurantia]
MQRLWHKRSRFAAPTGAALLPGQCALWLPPARRRPWVVATARLCASASTRDETRCSPTPLHAQASAELAKIDSTNAELETLARSSFHPDCEAAINRQINIEYNISYVYHTLFAYFDRDNIGLRGFAKYFKESSAEERAHAELLMQYNSKRGGRVVLQSLITPQSEFDHAEKGDALYAFELALSLEKLNFMKLRELHDVALANNDAPLVHFVKNQLLADQADSVKKVSEFVSQLRRVDKGLGVFEFDARLSKMA